MTRPTILGLCCLSLFASSIPADELTKPDPAAIEFFENKIRPVLSEHCYKCHSSDAKSVKGGLLLDTREGTRKGGDSGPAVVPGNVDESLLIAALTFESFEMPPTGKLSDSVINDFRKWIESGAADPRDGKVTSSSIDFEEARRFWSFQPVHRPGRPSVKNKSWVKSELDYFTLAQLEQRGLTPAGPATKHELIRRATFDLTGLPPTPEEVKAFVADESPDAFAKVVDRLLDSPHYGERWGRHWLDVARYAEDQAHTFAVRANTSGFRYRDWVIDAFNSDLPYNQFVRLQIAGDLIGPQTEGSYDHLVALGLFGLGAQYYKNSDAARAAADELDDRVDTLTRGFLGLTVSCARCHDHKFDPIPTRDYYSLAGIFRSSKLHTVPLCSPEDLNKYNEGQQQIKTSDAEFKKFVADARATAAERKVDEIARYMIAVWKHHSAQAAGKPVKTSDLARQENISEFLLKRWISFLDQKQKGKIAALNSWYEAIDSLPKSDSSDVPAQIQQAASEFQSRISQQIDIRDGVATANLVKPDPNRPHKPGSPRFVTPLVTKVRPTAGIDVDITGAKELFLVVSDGGNGKSCDHSDWLNPVLVGEQGTLKLTDLKWKKLEGFSGGKINKNYTGQPLRVGGKQYENGIGVHAPTQIVYDIPDGYTRFKAVGGLDNSGSDQGGCGEEASIQFSVYTEPPTEGPATPGQDLLTKVLGKDGPFAVRDEDLGSFLAGDQQAEYNRLKTAIDEARKNAPPMYAVAHSYREDRPADMKVFVRGNPANQKEVAPRQFLQVLAAADSKPYQNGSGRLELANDIANSANPLTARVMVNRIWQKHFGRGIVNTPSNFGHLGERPTHPMLLDYLASVFVESGWSIKAIHREIMLSATWQLSSAPDSRNAEIDADNRFLWRMNRRRLDVESWRDALLQVSGRLDRSMGGPSTNLADSSNTRRTVYAKVSRHQLDNLLRLFDFPDANITASKRSETTVPQQQLFVLNSDFMVNQAKSFAVRLQQTEGTTADRIRLGILLAYGRPATEREVELGQLYLASKDDESDNSNRLNRWQRYTQVLLGANEFMYVD